MPRPTHRLLVLPLAGLAAAAPAPAVAQDAMPAECVASASLFAADGTRSTFATGTGVRALPGDRWSFQPTALTVLGSAGGPGGGFTNEIAARPGGDLVSFNRRYTSAGDGPPATVTATREQRVASDVGPTRALATGAGHVYRLSGRALVRHRYRPAGDGHFRLGAAETVARTGYGRNRTLMATIGRRDQATLLSTTSGGQLRRIVVGEDRATVRSDTRLRASGFRGARALVGTICGETARTLLVQTRSGDLRRFDEPAADADGSDIVDAGVVATGIRQFVSR